MVLPKYTNTDVGVSCAISVGWETQNSAFISGVEKVNFPQIILEASIVNANFFITFSFWRGPVIDHLKILAKNFNIKQLEVCSRQ